MRDGQIQGLRTTFPHDPQTSNNRPKLPPHLSTVPGRRGWSVLLAPFRLPGVSAFSRRCGGLVDVGVEGFKLAVVVSMRLRFARPLTTRTHAPEYRRSTTSPCLQCISHHLGSGPHHLHIARGHLNTLRTKDYSAFKPVKQSHQLDPQEDQPNFAPPQNPILMWCPVALLGPVKPKDSISMNCTAGSRMRQLMDTGALLGQLEDRRIWGLEGLKSVRLALFLLLLSMICAINESCCWKVALVSVGG